MDLAWCIQMTAEKSAGKNPPIHVSGHKKRKLQSKETAAQLLLLLFKTGALSFDITRH